VIQCRCWRTNTEKESEQKPAARGNGPQNNGFPGHMPIPDFDKYGLLPAGVHDCMLADVQSQLCWNSHRVTLCQLFQAFLVELRQHINQPILLDGSFVTDKEFPDDTDVVLDLVNAPEAVMWMGLGFMVSHQSRILSQYRVHFWVTLPGLKDFIQYFQYLGVKSATSKGLNSKHRKGILRVI